MEQKKNNSLPAFMYYKGISGETKGFSEKVPIPLELRNFPGDYVQLKVINLDQVLDVFSIKNDSYRRAYDLLNELDKEVMEGYKNNSFNVRSQIRYKENGYAVFRFINFELDSRDPDPKYHILFIVYEYVTTLI